MNQPAEHDGSLTIEQAIANLKQTDDSSSRYYAAWWLGRFRVDDEAAIQALINALADDSDRSPDGGYPLRRNAARALGKLGDRRAVPHLVESLDCSDYYVREAAAQALEELGDASCAAALMALLDGGLTDTQPIPGKPHLQHPYEAVIEALGKLGVTKAIPMIQPFLNHPIPKVQYAAARAMYQLTQEPVYGDRLVEALRGSDLQLRRSALMDLGAVGYLSAAEAIAQTHAENSLKLIALKGLLETRVSQLDSQPLSDEAIRVMTLMDTLL
jgi:phycocyanobilin lyase alpha subunit